MGLSKAQIAAKNLGHCMRRTRFNVSGGIRKGKPTKVMLERIEHMAGLGMSKKGIAEMLGYSVSWFSELTSRHIEIQEALNGGQSLGEYNYASLLQEAAKTGNVKAIVTKLERKHGWSSGSPGFNTGGTSGDRKALSERILDHVRSSSKEPGERSE